MAIPAPNSSDDGWSLPSRIVPTGRRSDCAGLGGFPPLGRGGIVPSRTRKAANSAGIRTFSGLASPVLLSVGTHLESCRWFSNLDYRGSDAMLKLIAMGLTSVLGIGLAGLFPEPPPRPGGGPPPPKAKAKKGAPGDELRKTYDL